jgi:hypothetical protein
MEHIPNFIADLGCHITKFGRLSIHSNCTWGLNSKYTCTMAEILWAITLHPVGVNVVPEVAIQSTVFWDVMWRSLLP